jgi:hypothetical protein
MFVGSGASSPEVSRVHKTTLSDLGQPDATPSEKGYVEKLGLDRVMHPVSGAVSADTESADAMRSTVRRRSDGGRSRGAARSSQSPSAFSFMRG